MKYLHVVAAVIRDESGRIFLAKRPDHKHQGGLWEFPGGKVDAGEDARTALERELHEELGIEVIQAHPLITVRHHYPDLSVELDVWQVDGFSGEAHGKEGQQVAWVAAERLHEYSFPEANLPIISAARLPHRYLITPEPMEWDTFLTGLEQALAQGIKLVQFRAKTLSDEEYLQLAAEVTARCHAAGAQVLLNAEPGCLAQTNADGIHLTSARLAALSERPVGPGKWLAASCHNEAELRQAQALGVDFAVLSPVAATASHPEAQPLGWEAAVRLIDGVNLPVFLLGGMGEGVLDRAHESGAQGVAGIRAWWGNRADELVLTGPSK